MYKPDAGFTTPDVVTIRTKDMIRPGDSAVLLRIDERDKRDIDEAASRMNVSSASFMRMALVQVSRRILAESYKP